jgi:two-component system response regulator HydG
MAALEKHEWAGNVRQLRNAIEKMVVLASGDTLGEEDLPAGILRGGESAPAEPAAPARPKEAPVATLAATEKEAILAVLAECGGNKTLAADRLGISRRTLHRKLNAWKSEE